MSRTLSQKPRPCSSPDVQVAWGREHLLGVPTPPFSSFFLVFRELALPSTLF